MLLSRPVAVAAQRSLVAPGSPTKNQDFTVDQAAATNEFSPTSGTATEQNRGQREYTVSGLDDTKSYAIALFRAEDVTVTEGGVATFKDANVNDVADWTKTDAVIETVNNASLTPADDDGIVLAVTPVNGVLKFTIDATKGDEVRPVIFLDADGGSNDTTNTVDVDLDANNQPTELFAVGGQKNWVAPESQTTGTAADGVVGTINKDANSFGLDTAPAGTAAADYNAADVDLTYFYDSNDAFAIDGAPATLAEFEAALSRGDGVVVNSYARDDSLASNFNIDGDGPTVGVATATAGTTGASVNDIKVEFDYGTPTTDTHYEAVLIERAPSVAGAAGTYAEIARVAIADDEDNVSTTFTYTDENVVAGKYFYRVAGIIDGDVGAKDETTEVTSTTPGADTGAPVATYSALVQDGGFSGDVNTGDQLRFIFDEAMTIQNGDAIRVLEGADANQAGSEERYTLTCGTNVTCSLNAAPVVIGGESYAANTVLTVTAGALVPDATVTGGDATLSVPAYVTNQSGVTDVAGNLWNLAGSDRDINADAGAPEMASAVANETAETVTVTYSSPVDCTNTAAVRAQFNYSDATTGTPTAITCNGTTTVVLTFDNVVTGAGNLTYTESTTEPNVRVRGLNGVEAASPETQAAS